MFQEHQRTIHEYTSQELRKREPLHLHEGEFEQEERESKRSLNLGKEQGVVRGEGMGGGGLVFWSDIM
jgi:hypothetical protein